MDPCGFCKIVDREAPADIVHESDAVLAFRDTNPQAPTHILLIPKEHVPSVREIGKHFGIYPATVQDHISALERKGSLQKRRFQSRTISVPEAARRGGFSFG